MTREPLHMGSRDSWRLLACLVVGCLMLAGGACKRHEPSEPVHAPAAPSESEFAVPTNVILVTIDTLRTDRLSCYGSTLVQTPHIDGFADEGVLFSNAATTVPFTLPAHSSILTGLYPPGHGVRENVGYVLDEGVPTLAETMSEAGWSTAGFVSAFVLDRRWGIGRGFDHYFDDFDLASFDTPDLGSVQRSGEVTIAETLRWIDDRPADRPFFVWLHLYDPHDPYEPPEPFKSMYPDRPYDGEVAYTDSLIGGLRSALEERGLLDDSMVILTSDHGEGLGDHGEASHGFFLYDTTVHVSLIVRPPGGLAAGRTVDSAVSHVDLVPTILDSVNVDPPGEIHGQSLLPLMEGDAESLDRPVYSESLYPLLHYGWAPLRALRTDRRKLISAPRPELYDLRGDGLEEHDLATELPAEVADLETKLAALREEIDQSEPGAGAKPDLDPQTLAQLQALGYAAGQGGVDLNEEDDRPRADPKDKIRIHRAIMRAQTKINTDPAAAERTLLAVLEKDPEVLDANQMLGQVNLSDGRYENALKYFQRALAVEPDHQNSLMGMAGAYRSLEKWDEALVGYRRLLDVSGSHTGATLAIADIEFSRGNLDEAALALDEAADTTEAPALINNKLGEVRVEQGREEEALSLFNRAIGESDSYSVPHFNLGVLYENRGDVGRAVTHYGKAIELAPKYYKAQFNLGMLMGRTGDADRQLELLEASIDSNPDFVQGYYYLSKLMMDHGQDLGRAEELVRQGIEKDPDHNQGPLGYYILADILNRTGRTREANDAVAMGKKIQAEM